MAIKCEKKKLIVRVLLEREGGGGEREREIERERDGNCVSFFRTI